MFSSSAAKSVKIIKNFKNLLTIHDRMSQFLDYLSHKNDCPRQCYDPVMLQIS